MFKPWTRWFSKSKFQLSLRKHGEDSCIGVQVCKSNGMSISRIQIYITLSRPSRNVLQKRISSYLYYLWSVSLSEATKGGILHLNLFLSKIWHQIIFRLPLPMMKNTQNPSLPRSVLVLITNRHKCFPPPTFFVLPPAKKKLFAQTTVHLIFWSSAFGGIEFSLRIPGH